ncbi:MAG: LytTR family transcriptional regulator DNA-binding domain-containing protein [Leptospiraceae bacterium]|nr:LytTR family transcriptional regulator DNA-binding domain-containing protein [Leptospiraceae bacterium]
MVKKKFTANTNILIVEDEPSAAKMLKVLVRDFFAKRKISIFWEKGLAGASTYIEDKQIDLILLDLNLNGENSFILAEKLIPLNTQVIIISGELEKAIEAFRYSVLDFVPKPVEPQRLNQALTKFSEKHNWRKRGKYLFCKLDEEVQLVPFVDITYLKADGKKTILYTKNTNPLVLNKNLTSIQKELPENFRRVHKSYITRVDFIQSIKLKPEMKIVLKNQETIPISRRLLAELKENGKL